VGCRWGGVITAALGGALLLMALSYLGLSEEWSMGMATFSTAGVRLLAIRYAVNQSST